MGRVKALVGLLALAAVVAVAAVCFTQLRTGQRLAPAAGKGDDRARDSAVRASSAPRQAMLGQLPERRPRDSRLDMADAAPDGARPALTPDALSAVLDEADRLVVAGESIAAHRMLSAVYRERRLDSLQRAELLRRLESTARDAFFAPGEPSLEPPYVLQPGELLIHIARKWDVSWQYLERLNGIDARRLRVGQRLKVVRGPFEAVVDLSDFELTVYLNGLWVRSYPVGTGRVDSTTPVGTFKVLEKVENPKYNGPEGNFAPDDPDNPVGEHWIALGGGYGIHGTVEPQSIGKQGSLGCIRMLADDVEEVYHLLVRGSQVTIRP